MHICKLITDFADEIKMTHRMNEFHNVESEIY